MTRSEAIKAFFIKSVLPVAAAMLLYFFFEYILRLSHAALSDITASQKTAVSVYKPETAAL